MRSHRVHDFPKHSVQAMARNLLDIHPSTLSLIEHGLIAPSERVMGRLSSIYGVPVEDLKRRLPTPPRRGRPRGESDSVDTDKWADGRRLFALILDSMRVRAKLLKVELAIDAKISLIYVKQLLSGRHPIPPNGVCVRLARACKTSPLRLLLLRVVSMAHPALRPGLMKVLLAQIEDRSRLTKASLELLAHMADGGWRRPL